jgi:hypothetical protein
VNFCKGVGMRTTIAIVISPFTHTVLHDMWREHI